MKVLYTNYMFTVQKFGGITRYFAELIDNLDADIEYSLPLCISNNEYLKGKKITKAIRLFPNYRFRGKLRKIISNLNVRSFEKACQKRDFDVVHPTYYDLAFLDCIGDTPFVVTIYDMIHELYPHLFGKNDNTTENKRLLCEKATKIIAISNHTKVDLVKIFNIDPNKIEVVYLGQSLNPHTGTYSLNLPSKYVLFTGQRGGYKNFERFAEAFSKLESDYHLVCTGPKFSDSELSYLDKLAIKDRTHAMYVSDNELSEIYSRASLFVFPSEYEGFGMLVLEAFACNCPIALSDASCFPEIAQDGGAYFNPLDVDSIYQTMKSVLEDEELRERLIANAQKQLSKFSWQRTAMETSSIYRSIK